MKKLISIALILCLAVCAWTLTDDQKKQILLEEWHTAMKPITHPVVSETRVEKFTACETSPVPEEEAEPIPPELQKKIILKGLVPLKTAVSEISAAAGLTAVIGRDIDLNQSISMNYKDISIADALETMLTPLGYNYEVKGSQIHIQAYITRTFRIFMPSLSQAYSASITNVSGKSGATGTTGGLTIGTNIKVSTEVKDLSLWVDVESNIKDLISEKGRYTINRTAGLVSVRDYVPTVREIEQYITFVNREISKQILIKAKILEVALTNEKAYGINWELVRDRFTMTTDFQFQKVTSGTPAIFNLPYGIGDIGIDGISAVIKALEEQGKVTVISQPQMLVLNNQPACIQVGDISTYVSKLEHSITETQTETFSVDTDSFQSGVTMSLIARIVDPNHIFLNICPVITSLLSMDRADFGDNYIQLPQTNSRSMNSIIKVKNAETIVIGGLILQKNEHATQGLPVLCRMPILRWFFGTTETRKAISEIVIFLTPIVEPTLL